MPSPFCEVSMASVNKGKISGAIVNSRLPADYKLVSFFLLHHVRTSGDPLLIGLAWPTTSTLALESGLREAQVQVLMENLAFWGCMSVERHPYNRHAAYRFNVQRLAATDPLAALLLRDRLRRLKRSKDKALNDQEHWVLEILGKYAIVGDPLIEVRISWRLIQQELPWFTPNKWQWALRTLRKAGIITNVGTSPNRHRRWIHLVIDPSAVPSHGSAPQPRAESHSVLDQGRAESHSVLDQPRAESHSVLDQGRAESHSVLDQPRAESHSVAEFPHINDRARNTSVRTPQGLNTLLSPPPPQAEAGAVRQTPFFERMRLLEPAAAYELRRLVRTEAEAGQVWHESLADEVLNERDRLATNPNINDPYAVIISDLRYRVATGDLTRQSESPRRLTLDEIEAAERERREEIEAWERGRSDARGRYSGSQLGDAGQLWAAALGQLQMQITRPNFDTWLKHTSGLSWTEEEFVVGCPNAFVAEMIEQRMYSLVAQTLESVVEREEVEVRFAVESTWTPFGSEEG